MSGYTRVCQGRFSKHAWYGGACRRCAAKDPQMPDDLRRLWRIANGPPEWHRKDDPEVGALLKAGHVYIASVLGDFITPAITIEGRNALNQ